MQYIVMHWGVVTNISQIDTEVANPNREMSYTYALDKEEIHQYVSENDTAWHAGVFDINQRSIGICIAAGPSYPYCDRDYESAAQLIADIFRRHGRLEIKAHRDFKPTECPGNLDFGRLRARVDEILNPPAPVAPAPAPTPPPAPVVEPTPEPAVPPAPTPEPITPPVPAPETPPVEVLPVEPIEVPETPPMPELPVDEPTPTEVPQVNEQADIEYLKKLGVQMITDKVVRAKVFAKLLELLGSLRFWTLTLAAVVAELTGIAKSGFNLIDLLNIIQVWLLAVAGVGTLDSIAKNISAKKNIT